MLDDRKLKVLYSIIDNYIKSAEPTGSRTIWKEYDFGISAATIRNEMSDLEELGYLSKPHSSAGRIPSDKAYRLYVNDILKMKDKFSNESSSEKIRDILLEEAGRVENLIENSAKVLSAITSYTSLVVSPKMRTSLIEHIELLPIDNLGILIVIVCSTGMVKNTIYKPEEAISLDDLNTISNFLNRNLTGLSIDEMLLKLNTDIFKEIYQVKSILDDLIPIINSSLEDLVAVDLYSEGVSNILNFPEYKDVEKAKEFISFVENKDMILNVLSETSSSNDIDIIIGNENIHAPIKDLSIITARYEIGGKTIGRVGLIGPTRMDYIKLINTIEVFSTNISEILNLLIRSEDR